jgi:hypothetical protein
MTTFEKEFPSLKEKGFHNVDVIMGNHCFEKRTSHYTEEELIDSCLDKSKVRDAIEKICCKIEDFPEDKQYNQALRDLKKELGL